MSQEATKAFTPRALQVLALAKDEARRLNHTSVGSEHLLLGLIKLGKGVTVNVLQELGLDLETIRVAVEKAVGAGPDQKIIGDIPYSPRAEKVLALSVQYAKFLNHDFVGTEDIFLGLLREGDGSGARVLKGLNVDIEKTRLSILKELIPNFALGEEPLAAAATPDEAACLLDKSTPNFTPRAQQVLALAQEEARRLNHNFVGTEHLLLGLIKLGQGVAVSVLQKLGLVLETVRKAVVKAVGAGPDQKIIGRIPYTPRAKKVLALAAKEARNLKHTYVGTEHILLGLLREADGAAARVMRELNVDIGKTRLEILKELNPNFASGAEPQAGG
jgi:ATP-dependent Clp protease ATP-binding subunit ClpA